MDILRLIVIVIIFSGIIAVLLYLKSAKSGRKTKKKYMQATNPSDSSSKEEMHSAGAVDDFLSIEAETDHKDREGEIDTQSEAGIKDIKAEFTTIIEGLISTIEEREKKVVNKVENIIDTKVQEVLSKINGRIDEVLLAQKNSNALVLEKMLNSLREKKTPVGIKSSKRSKKAVGKKVELEEITEKDLTAPDEDSDNLGKLDSSLQVEGTSVGISFSDESDNTEVVAKVPEKTKEDDLEMPSEVKEDLKAEKEQPIVSSEVIEKNVLELDEADSADFSIQEFLEELGDLPSEKDPETEK